MNDQPRKIRPLDEIPNFVLQGGLDVTRDDIAVELDRVADVIRAHVLTGDDLTYWLNREVILNRLLD